LVQDSFALVAPVAEEVSAQFYDRLFTLAPEARALFPSDLTEQRKKLMYTLTLVIANLKNLDAVKPAVEALGRRHVEYGATSAHYEIVGQALIDTLERGLGAAFTDEVRAAWLSAYGVIATTMTAAAAAR